MVYTKFLAFILWILKLASCEYRCAPTDPFSLGVSRCCSNEGLGPVCKIFEDQDSKICDQDGLDSCDQQNGKDVEGFNCAGTLKSKVLDSKFYDETLTEQIHTISYSDLFTLSDTRCQITDCFITVKTFDDKGNTVYLNSTKDYGYSLVNNGRTVEFQDRDTTGHSSYQPLVTDFILQINTASSALNVP
jgi:hypothetical protein